MGSEGAPAIAAAEDRVFASVAAALGRAIRFDEPYRHWTVPELLPRDVINTLTAFDIPAPEIGGLSGKREHHNDTRHYLDRGTIAGHAGAAALANAFQTPHIIASIEELFETELEGTYLRIEYAQDVDGFWLEPHRDLQVKKLTLQLCLSTDGQTDLGTDIYNRDRKPVKRAQFEPNTAFAFVPADNTWHGFEKRKIIGVRRSLILNYVTKEWRARDQLCFPDEPVSRR